MRYLIPLVILLISNNISQAQDSTELDPVTITASLHPVPVSGTGRNIQIIRGEYFNQFPVHSIDELLRYIPGLEIQARGPQGSQSDIVIRGSTFQQSLVILDGIRLNDPNTGHFSSYIPISPSEIDRIEVLKGASSSVYGAEAVGGVINIISKTFAARSKEEKKSLDIAATAGEYGLWNFNAGGYMSSNNTAIAGGIISNNAQGQKQRGTRGGFNNHTASLSWKQYLGDRWSLSVRSSYDQRKFSAQNFYTGFKSDTANEQVTTNWNQARLSYSGGRHTINLDAGYKNVKDVYQFNPGSVANNNRSSLWQVLLTDHLKLATHSTLVSGFQMLNKRIRSNDRGNHSLDQVAGFLVLHQQFGDLTLSPSLRADWNENRGMEFIPQLNISLRKSKWQYRASGGKTIRDADFTELYNNYNKSMVSGGSVGNPWLTEERSVNIELGADYFALPSLKISSGIFRRNQSQLIDWVPTSYADMPRKENLSPTGSFALARNIAKVTTSGIELDAQWRKSWNKNNLQVSSGILWLDTEIENAVPSFYLSSHAKFLANLSAMYSINKLTFSVNGIYKVREKQTAPAILAEISKSYMVFNFKTDYAFLNNRFKVFVQADNLFDSHYSDLLGSPMPGRWLMAGLRYSYR